MKKTLLSLIGALTLATAPIQTAQAQTIEPHGSIEVSYVPARNDGVFYYQNQLKTSLDFNLNFILNKDMTIYIGSKETTYMTSDFSDLKRGVFQPSNQDYLFYAGFQYQNLDFLIKHNCLHGFGDFSQSDSGETEVGVKWKW